MTERPSMRTRLLLMLAVLAATLAAPAAASAAPAVGISENSPAMFADPLFQGLGVKQARVVASWNVMTSGDDELARLSAYLYAARDAGVEPLVAFEHARGDASVCSVAKNRRKAVCRLPTPAQYEAALQRFFEAFPFVHVVSPWNEINHFTQGTARDPKAAAKLTDVAHAVCPACTLVVADVLDEADNPAAARPVYRRTLAFIAAFRKALTTKRTICGIHNYSDVNRFRSTGTTALIKALGCKQIWLTETGGLYRFASFWGRSTRKGCSSNAACQLKATKYMFALARASRSIKRLYVYTWYGGMTPRFDSGLVARDTARPALAEVRRHLAG